MSAILSADDLNDFISPGVACIKPVEVKNDKRNNNSGGLEIEIEIDGEGNTLEVVKDTGKSSKLQEAQISLADCLACSGCITSAEEVLVAQHSHKELINNLKNNSEGKIFVVSISHQTRASLSLALNLSIDATDKFLINLFINKLKFSKIIGVGLGRQISNMNISKDIIDLKLNKLNLSTTNTQIEGPMLSSICPGWVLYAEKTHPYIIPRINTVKSPQQITGHLLKKLTSREYNITRDKVYHLSIMPCFDKKLESARPEAEQDQDPQQLQQANDEATSVHVPDVDCVITAKELIQLLQDEEMEIDSIIEEVVNDTQSNISELYERFAPLNWYKPVESWLNDKGSVSGGYAYQFLQNLKMYHLNQDPSLIPADLEIKTVIGRNSDIYELKLINLKQEGKVLGSSGVVNGFKNIQNLVRKLKLLNTGKSSSAGVGINRPGRTIGAPSAGGRLAAKRRERELAKKGLGEDASSTNTGSTANNSTFEDIDLTKSDFIEIMACPGGCVNGGGQISGPKEINAKEWTQELSNRYYTIQDINGAETKNKEDILKWMEIILDDYHINLDRLIRTGFKEVEKPKDTTSIALGSKW